MTISSENKSNKSDNNNDTNPDYLEDLKNKLNESISNNSNKSDNNNTNLDYLEDLENTLIKSISNSSRSKDKTQKTLQLDSTSQKDSNSQKTQQLDSNSQKTQQLDSNNTPFSILKLGSPTTKTEYKQTRGILTSTVDTDPNTETKDSSIKLKQQPEPKNDTIKDITKGFSDLFKDISTSTSDATSVVKKNIKAAESINTNKILKTTDSTIKMTGILSFFSWRIIGIIIFVIVILLLIVNFIFSGSKTSILQQIIKLIGNLVSFITNFGNNSNVDLISDTDDTIDSMETTIGIKGTHRNMINNDSSPSTENIAEGSNTFNINPDNIDSSTQKAKHVKNSGYCYIGEDRGFRSCLQVEKGDKCMSGDIFPSKELCINPNLRQ